jgi:uncharacterized protein (DUF885 family)
MLLARFLVALILASPATASPAPAAESAKAGSGDAAFRRDVDRFVEAEFRLNPERATQAGDHRFDDQVTDRSEEGIKARVSHASAWREKFSSIDPAALSAEERADREWLVSGLDGVILRLATIRAETKNPGVYLPTSAVYGLVKRSFAPAEERMRLATRREIAAIANFDAARKNLGVETPKVSIEIVLQQMPGTLGFFQKDLPAAFANVPSGPEKSAFLEANAKVVAAIGAYEKWLREELLPAAAGKFAIGAEAYQKMLAADDMVDLPLPVVEAIGKQELGRLRKEFADTAARIDPSKKPEEVFESLAREHPKSGEILSTVRAGLEELRSFVIERHLASLPSDVRPIVQETPPFARATSFASMDTPGPFEKAPEAYFNVTLPDPSWKPEQIEQLLQFFSAPSISDFSTHEVYPGHYTQFLNNRLNPDKVRSLYPSGANAEGWALYCEEMMLDQGLRGEDPKARLAQIQAALLRACRYLVGIALHTHGMSIDDAADFFQRNAAMNAHNAWVEALRGTQDPGYLRYQLGKLMIVKLRDDVKKKQGAAFDLGKFHDAFLKEGAIPVKLIRRALLGDEGPVL